MRPLGRVVSQTVTMKMSAHAYWGRLTSPDDNVGVRQGGARKINQDAS